MVSNRALAILGGSPVRKTAFQSKPMIDSREIDLVISLMKEGRFSQFVGSPIPGTSDLLKKQSLEVPLEDLGANYLGGEYVRKFEAEWSKIVGSDYCISVNSATSGLTTALLALGLEPGSEVITTPFSFTATVGAIVAANCVPVFCDIDHDTFCLSPEHLKSSITERTKCVLPVHWCGNAGELDKINSICKKYNLFMVEDAAQAPLSFYRCSKRCFGCADSCEGLIQGKAIGTFGDIGVFSFNQPKNLMTGEGGLIVTNDESIAVKCRLIRNHGEAIVNDEDSDDFISNVVGFNFRLSEIHAAIAYIQTTKHRKINKIRKENYQYLVKNLMLEFSDFLTPQKITHPDSYYSYTAAFRWNYRDAGVTRDTVAYALIAEGIPVFKGYHRLMCDHPMFKRKIAFGKNHHPWVNNNIYYTDLELPNARNLVENEFLGFLQIGWPNTAQDMDDIVRAFGKILANKNALANFEIKENKTTFILGR